MTETKFTPGPWESFLLVDEAEISAPMKNGALIADVFCGRSFTVKGASEITEQECHANAALIAAAPLLYEMLDKARQGWEITSDNYDEVEIDGEMIFPLDLTIAIRTALAKARGES